MSSYPRFDGTQACAAAPPAAAAAFAAAPGADPALAKTLCGTCNFLAECRAYALIADVSGVWGGLDAADRDQARAAGGLPAPRPVSDDLDDLVRLWRAQAGDDPPAHERRRSARAA